MLGHSDHLGRTVAMDDYARQEPILCQIASLSVEYVLQHRAAPQPVEIVASASASATIAEALSSLKCLNASAVPRRKATSSGIGAVGSRGKHERLHRRARLRSSRRPVRVVQRVVGRKVRWM